MLPPFIHKRLTPPTLSSTRPQPRCSSTITGAGPVSYTHLDVYKRQVLLHDAGLIETDEQGKVISWKAFSQRAGGTAEIRLSDPTDTEAAAALKTVMEQLASDPDSGILEMCIRDRCQNDR